MNEKNNEQTMIIIVKLDFDSLENHLPYHYSFVGYAEDEKTADKWIEENDKRLYKFKGWNGRVYPAYVKIPVEKISLNNCASDGLYKENVCARIDNVGRIYSYDTTAEKLVEIDT